VWLAELGSTPVVIKQVVGGATAAARFTRETTALRLAARVDPPVAPAVLGVDADHQVMVLEHIAGGPAPEDWIVGYATALARLHAATTAADAAALPGWSGPDARDVDAFMAFAAALAADVPDAVADELAALVARLSTPAGFALLHGDPCPANDLYTTCGVRFVDFEQASLGDGITELAYLRIGFPTCWCATAPDPALVAEAESAYRTAPGTEPAGDLADACAGWLIRGDALVERAHRDGTDHLAVASREDWMWGTATARQRLLHRLGVVADLATDRLAALGRLAADLRGRMLTAWPALEPLPARRP
jgi:tRNA A-37 threonylcarbamoyl transferase component Bud32